MRLDSVSIKNFRSIAFVHLHFNFDCLILAGINESGKSNILKALSTLGSFLPPVDDIREPAPGESPVTDSEIHFRFSFEKSETNRLAAELAKQIVVKNKATIIATTEGRKFNFEEFVAHRANGLFDVDIIKQSKRANYWTIGRGYKLADGWCKPSPHCPVDLTVGGIQVSKMRFLHRPDYPGQPDSFFEAVTIDDLAEFIGAAVSKFIGENLPKTLFWQYKESNLLPASISMDAFIADPESCIPLRNMFWLADIEDIPDALTKARSRSRNALDNFFSGVAKKTTKHFRNVWKEHKAIEFELRPDGENIIAGVREKNVFDFSKRSDGFKRFVSFLLLVSANVKSGYLADTLLLIDEPDISLHPSGARYLRDELIKISDTNKVVFSTHSIFMIDRERIDRHLIVSKSNEQTQTEIASDNNLIAEEVIYNAMGYSIFEMLRESNVIFEGWRDKQLYLIATKSLPASHAHLREAVSSIGVCHAKGVKHIKSITPMIELANRKCLVVSDGDVPAREKQKEFISDGGYGVWKRYDELMETNDVESHLTGEDFIIPKVFEGALKKARSRHPHLPEFDIQELKNGDPKLRSIDRWLGKGGLAKEIRKAELDSIKQDLITDLRSGDIEAKYFEVLESIVKQVALL